MVLVSDQVPRIHALDDEGTQIGRARAANNGAHGMAVAPDGSVFLAELAPETITKLAGWVAERSGGGTHRPPSPHLTPHIGG